MGVVARSTNSPPSSSRMLHFLLVSTVASLVVALHLLCLPVARPVSRRCIYPHVPSLIISRSSDSTQSNVSCFLHLRSSFCLEQPEASRRADVYVAAWSSGRVRIDIPACRTRRLTSNRQGTLHPNLTALTFLTSFQGKIKNAEDATNPSSSWVKAGEILCSHAAAWAGSSSAPCPPVGTGSRVSIVHVSSYLALLAAEHSAPLPDESRPCPLPT